MTRCEKAVYRCDAGRCSSETVMPPSLEEVELLTLKARGWVTVDERGIQRHYCSAACWVRVGKPKP